MEDLPSQKDKEMKAVHEELLVCAGSSFYNNMFAPYSFTDLECTQIALFHFFFLTKHLCAYIAKKNKYLKEKLIGIIYLYIVKLLFLCAY